METAPDARLVKRWYTNFADGRLPHWLKPRQDGIFAASTIQASTDPTGGMAIITAGPSTASGVEAEAFDLSKCVRASIQVVATGGGTNTLGMSVGFHDAANSRGVRILRNANNPTVLIQAFQPADIFFNTAFRSWETADRRTLIGLEILPNEKSLGAPVRVTRLLLDGELHTQQTIPAADMPLDQLVQPRFQISSASGAAGPDTRILQSLEVKRLYT